MNHIVLIGNIVREPELRTTPTGKQVCSFDIACNRRRHVEGQPDADYFRCNAWNGLADICGKYLSKGKKVAVKGSISLSKREKDGKFYASMEVFADDVEFLSPKEEPKTDAASGMQEVQPYDLPY